MGVKVRELLTRDLSAIEREAKLEELVELLEASGLSGLPVVDEEGRVVGFISERDVLEAALPGYFEALEGSQLGIGQLVERYRKIKDHPVERYMSEVVTVHEDEDGLVVADLMIRRNLKVVPVVDSEGFLLGVVRRIDLLKGCLSEGEGEEGERRGRP